jgi:hypothetical protein
MNPSPTTNTPVIFVGEGFIPSRNIAETTLPQQALSAPIHPEDPLEDANGGVNSSTKVAQIAVDASAFHHIQ